MSQTNVIRNVKRLFVGNLPWTISTKELKMYFSKFGHIQDAVVVFDRKIGVSKGYGFVTFSTREGFDTASNQQNHQLEGKFLQVNLSNS